jgi:hypothetical protein
MHYRDNYHGYGKFGVGSIDNCGSVSMEHNPPKEGGGPGSPDARFDLYPYNGQQGTITYGVGMNVSGPSTYTQLYFAPSNIYYAGTIRTTHANISSTENIKNNITAVSGNEVLNLFNLDQS